MVAGAGAASRWGSTGLVRARATSTYCCESLQANVGSVGHWLLQRLPQGVEVMSWS